MFYFALKDAKERIIDKLKNELGGSDRIKVRGFRIDEVKIPSELSGPLLPVNLLANKYCPTNRDIFLKIVKNVNPKPTWPSYQGKIIHELCFRILERVQRYVSRSNIIRKINLFRYTLRSGNKIVKEITSDIDEQIKNMIKKPSNREKRGFINNLYKLVRMESEIVSTFIDYIIATNVDVRLDSEFHRIFPFQCEISLNATPLGLSRGVKPDFIYSPGNTLVIGDIKTGQIKDFHKLTLAAYALAYEYHENVPVDFGVILNINFSNRRNVPIYKNTECIIISDKYRQAFLELRDEKFSIITEGKEPDFPSDENICVNCPYYWFCRGEQHE